MVGTIYQNEGVTVGVQFQEGVLDTGFGIDFLPRPGEGAGYPNPGTGLAVRKPAGLPVLVGGGRPRPINVEVLDTVPNPQPRARGGGGLGGSAGNTRVSPYRTSNPYSGDGITRRRPSRVGGGGGSAPGSGALLTALDIGYEIATLVETFTPIPCAQISDQDFYDELGIARQDISQQLQNAQNLREVAAVSGSIATVSAGALGAVTLLGLATGGVAAIPAGLFYFLLGTTGVSGATNIISRNLYTQGLQNDRNNAIYRARGSTARRWERGDEGDCPLPTDRQLLRRILDCCFPEVSFTVRREFRRQSETSGIPPVETAVLDLLFISNTLVDGAYISWPGGELFLNNLNVSRTDRTTFVELIGSETIALTAENGIDFSTDVPFTLALDVTGRVVLRDCVLPALRDGGVSVIPEWWPARPGADRPQLVITFCEKRDNGTLNRSRRFVMTIPHWTGEEPILTSPIGPHKKGSIFTELTLSDNSKVRVYAESEQEGQRIISEALQVIDPEFVITTDPSFKRIENPDMYPEIEVVPIKATYFEEGQLSTDSPKAYYFD